MLIPYSLLWMQIFALDATQSQTTRVIQVLARDGVILLRMLHSRNICLTTRMIHKRYVVVHLTCLHILTLVQKSACSNHNEVNMANVKLKKGCDSTGIGMVVCARHGMRLPNGVVDLQFGER